MPVYTYTAKDLKGNRVTGDMAADSRQHLFTQLADINLYPTSVVEKKGVRVKKEASKKIVLFSRIKKKNIAVFSRQLSTMIKAGVPLVIALDVLVKQEENLLFRKNLIFLKEEVMKGNTLSSALSKAGVFPRLLVTMAAVGEANGRMDISFDRIAATMEKEIKMNAKIVGAMIYPMILLIFSILSSIVLTVAVIPVFVNMFNQFDTELPLLTRIFIKISDIVRTKYYILIPGIIVLIILIRYLYKNTPLNRIIDKLSFSLPVIGKTRITIIMARFCRTLASLLEAGVSVISSLETVRNVLGSSYLNTRFEEILKSIQGGSNLSAATSRAGFLSPLVVNMIRVGEESGRLDEMLEKTAEIYEDESDTQLQKLTAMMEPLVTVLIALIVGFIVLSIIQPLFTMYSTIAG